VVNLYLRPIMIKEKVGWIFASIGLFFMLVFVSFNQHLPDGIVKRLPFHFPYLWLLGLRIILFWVMIKPRFFSKRKKVFYFLFAFDFSVFALQKCLETCNGIPLLILALAWCLLYLLYVTNRRLF